MSPKPQHEPDGLDHVVVAGGTPQEWLAMDSGEWRHRVAAFASGAGAGGAHWVTVLAHHGVPFDERASEIFSRTLAEAGKFVEVSVAHGSRYLWRNDAGVSVIIDSSPDGHARFAATVEGLRRRGVDPDSVDEDVLSRAILEPAVDEPDLVVVVGRPDLLPDSMVWELAYSELVFLDIGWGDVTANHLELAIDDFNRRHRRFGGLDS